MGSSGVRLAASVWTVCAWVAVPAHAQQSPAPPDFSFHYGVGWASADGNGANFSPVPGKLPPVADDPAHPYVPNGRGIQPTFRIGDVSNPNLKPWVKEQMKKDNDEVLAGKAAFTARSSCMPAGVPGYMAYGGGDEPIYFVQTPKTVLMIYQGNQEVRHIHLDVPHSENPKPSWYGESVGHYEGDTLVIDTIAQNTDTFLDFYRTPHTDKLHVVERWRKIDNGRFIEVVFTVRLLCALDRVAPLAACRAPYDRGTLRREQSAFRLAYSGRRQAGFLIAVRAQGPRCGRASERGDASKYHGGRRGVEPDIDPAISRFGLLPRHDDAKFRC
jgi:hypothetical protein